MSTNANNTSANETSANNTSANETSTNNIITINVLHSSGRPSKLNIKKSDLDEMMIRNACINRVMKEISHSEIIGNSGVFAKHISHCIKLSESSNSHEPSNMSSQKSWYIHK